MSMCENFSKSFVEPPRFLLPSGKTFCGFGCMTQGHKLHFHEILLGRLDVLRCSFSDDSVKPCGWGCLLGMLVFNL